MWGGVKGNSCYGGNVLLVTFVANGVCRKMKAIINPQYLSLYDFVLSIPACFDTLSGAETLHEGRNVVKVVEVNDVKVVVKSYERISSLNRVLYGTLRESKSMRAYYNALKLCYWGINTPEPIAAIDTFHCGLLNRSFFVSAYSDFGPLTEIADDEDISNREMLDSLVEFIVTMHNAGVVHNDLNIRNIRYKQRGEGYEFEVIDNNRMRFYKHLSERHRLHDLRHLNCSSLPFVYMLERYAQLANVDVRDFPLKGVASRLLYRKRNRIKYQVKTLVTK